MKHLLHFLFWSFLLVGCHSSSVITSAHKIDSLTEQKREILPETAAWRKAVNIFEKVQERQHSFRTFSAKVNIDYEDEYGKQPQSRAYIRIRKDSLIWISLSGTLLNIEGFRVRITPDSIWILDKLEKSYGKYPYQKIEQFTGLPLSFSALQDLLTGNILYPENEIQSIYALPGFLQIVTEGTTVKNIISINTKHDLVALQELEIQQNGSVFHAGLFYPQYQKTDEGWFSVSREIKTEQPVSRVLLDFKQYEFNKELSYPFNIPESYKKKN